MPQVGAVSLEQYRAAGVPVVSHATWMQEFELERCWTYTSLGVLLQLVSIELDNCFIHGFLNFGSMLCSLGTFLT